jgi:hypothetical protein
MEPGQLSDMQHDLFNAISFDHLPDPDADGHRRGARPFP